MTSNEHVTYEHIRVQAHVVFSAEIAKHITSINLRISINTDNFNYLLKVHNITEFIRRIQ